MLLLWPTWAAALDAAVKCQATKANLAATHAACLIRAAAKAEQAAQCSCCASQLCDCAPNVETNLAVAGLDAAQRADGDTPQCDLNGTLCGAVP